MRMFNSDGSEAEMCGNANKNVIRVETLAGIKVLELTVQDGKAKLVKVDMGEPILKPENIPVNSKEFKVTCVSMGNPHAVSYVKNVDIFPLEKIGSKKNKCRVCGSDRQNHPENAGLGKRRGGWHRC